uniref:Uncharacterized protein n=1 Tax=Branchiostoma floridae TaxID=7739 RepID=C3ZR47_BRAFL|eukprot:XP_002588909.1 hypothetical protein BRAFLDRAFT_89097 [Branchiostoma floridae]
MRWSSTYISGIGSFSGCTCAGRGWAGPGARARPVESVRRLNRPCHYRPVGVSYFGGDEMIRTQRYAPGRRLVPGTGPSAGAIAGQQLGIQISRPGQHWPAPSLK